MGSVISYLSENVLILGAKIPFGVVMIVGLAVSFIVVACCYVRCCSSPTPTTAESFKWPNSSKFLKRIDPAHPPALVVDKFEDPVRTDVLPLDEETFWIVTYQPNGERPELEQQMYLKFKGGLVYGLGYEEARKLCKISGKYKHFKRANQTALYFDCKFSNECDSVLFHGWGNGTGFVGNCYIREINPYSTFADVPGVRQLTCDTFKGSFQMLKQSGMGDSSLRARVHTRRVHKWAGECYPDDSVPLPQSPLHSPGSMSPTSSSAERGAGYIPVEGLGRGGHEARPPSPPASPRSHRRKHSRNTSAGGGVGKKVRHFFHRKKPSTDSGRRPSLVSTTGVGAVGETPPWVQQSVGTSPTPSHGGGLDAGVGSGGFGSGSGVGYGNGDGGGGDDDYPESSVGSPRRVRRPAKPVDTTNYLALQGVPGRSGDLV